MKKIVIIHLSDFHIQKDDDFKGGTPLNTLKRDISTNLTDISRHSIYVVVSGDLTFHGKTEEFKSAKRYLDEIKGELAPDALILSPGNHDLNWDDQDRSYKSRKLMAEIIEGSEKAKEEIEDMFTNPENFNKYLASGMKNYHDFLHSMGTTPNQEVNLLFSFLPIEIETIKLNFVSMNSAYLFSDKFDNYNYYGYINETQIDTAYQRTMVGQGDGYNFNVATFHHPFDAFPELVRVQSENKIKSYYNLILTGHVHNMSVHNDYTYVNSGGGTGNIYRAMPTVISSARCVQDSSKGYPDPTIVPGYSIFEIYVNEGKIGPINVYQRRLNTQLGWQRDTTVDDPVNIYVRPIEPTVITAESTVYKAGKDILDQGSSNSIAVYQKTPSLVLGPHKFCSSDKERTAYEEEFMKTLYQKIENCSPVRREKVSVLYLFDLEATKEAIAQCKQNGDPIDQKVCTSIRDLKSKSENSGHLEHRFIFEPTTFETLGPFIFADEGAILYIGRRRGETLVFNTQSNNRNKELYAELKARFTEAETTADDLIRDLGLQCNP